MRPITRRTLLRGAGAAVALPWLEAMSPAGTASVPAKPPIRMCFYIVGGGAYMPYWTLDDSGRRTELPGPKAVEFKGKPMEANEPLARLSPSLEPLTSGLVVDRISCGCQPELRIDWEWFVGPHVLSPY